MASGTTDYGYLLSRRASPLFDLYQIILLGEQMNICENNLSGRAPAGSRTSYLTITSPTHYYYTTK